MHSLHLGGVEFGPTHTVDEHRPKDFKLPDIALNDTDHDHNETSSILAKNLTSNDIAAEIKQNDTANNHTTYTDDAQLGDLDMWNDELWLDATFKQMHDPKHRHPRHHGKSSGSNYLRLTYYYYNYYYLFGDKIVTRLGKER